MAAHAGEIARQTGDCRRGKCHERTNGAEGKRIPTRRDCGNDALDTRYNDPRNRSF